MGFKLGFFKNMGKATVQKAANSLQEAIVRFDPETATEAAILEMEEVYDKYNKDLSRLIQEYNKEQKEADEIQALYNKRIAAAEILEGQVEAGGKGSKQAEEGLAQLLETLEEMQEDVEMESQEAEDARLLMEDMKSTVNMLGKKLKTARKDATKAQNAMKRAAAQKKRAELAEQQAKQKAGLSSETDSISSALSTMNKLADQAKGDAEAAKRKSELLAPGSAEDNSAVAAAMAAASGEDPAPTSVSDRLAALKKGKATA